MTNKEDQDQKHQGSTEKVQEKTPQTRIQPTTAGRELDALIAEKVMGLHDVREARFAPGLWLTGGLVEIPRYSTSIADAWLVVEKLGPYFRITRGAYTTGDYENLSLVDDYEAEFLQFPDPGDKPSAYGRAETAPLAICLAALESIESRALEPEK